MRLQPDDREATFIAMYREHVDAVFGIAARLTGSASEAEDVVSETFLVAWRRRDQLARDPRPLRPWLLGVAVRQALNANRGRRRRATVTDRLTVESVAAHPDHADDVAGRLDDADTLARTREALRSLSKHEAEALALCVWSDLSYADAAAALNVSVASVRTRLARARRKLRVAAEPAARPTRAPEPVRSRS